MFPSSHSYFMSIDKPTVVLKSRAYATGLGLTPPLSLIFYKNFITRAMEID